LRDFAAPALAPLDFAVRPAAFVRPVARDGTARGARDATRARAAAPDDRTALPASGRGFGAAGRDASGVRWISVNRTWSPTLS
jgi:hypothetical protein